MMSRATRQVAGQRELAARIGQLTATARSPDGGIAVTVRPGVVTAVTLTDAAVRRSSAELGRLIVSTIGRAQAKLGKRLAAQLDRRAAASQRYGDAGVNR
jgi:hypothetical protein